jgi:hypothetical protein
MKTVNQWSMVALSTLSKALTAPRVDAQTPGPVGPLAGRPAGLCDPQHPQFALRRPDFHFLQSFTLVTGEV